MRLSILLSLCALPALVFFTLPNTVRADDVDPAIQPSNHSPLFFVDESTLKTGVNVLTNLVVDYLAQAQAGSH